MCGIMLPMENSLDLKNIKSKIEKSANFEGNMSVLLFERLNNPIIKQRLVDMFIKHHQDADDEGYYRGMSAEEKSKAKPSPNWKKEGKTKEQIEKELNKIIDKIFSRTNVTYGDDNDHPNGSKGLGIRENISPCLVNADTGQKLTLKQLSITEAHEKGHSIRSLSFEGDSIPEIEAGFDFSKITIDDKLRDIFLKSISKGLPMEVKPPVDKIDQAIVNSFRNPNEIIERMAQLKNYFGMKGSEEFTKEHLDYAKKHYSSDTGFVLQIKPFLDAITPETESKFLELINSLGI